MANFATLKAAIAAAIKQNGNKEITGDLLQQQLLAMVNSLGAGYQFAGVATPDTNPGTPDQKVFYFAVQPGEYVNFSGMDVTGFAILYYDSSWHVSNIKGIDANPQKNSQNLVQSGGVFNDVFGNITTETRTWTDIQNQFVYYGLTGGELLLIQLRTTDEMAIEVNAEISGGFTEIGRLSNDNDIIAARVPDNATGYIAFTHSTTGTVTGTIDVCIVDDVSKLPYRFYKLFQDAENLKASVSQLETDVEQAEELVNSIDNKPFIKSYKQLNGAWYNLVQCILSLKLFVKEEIADDEFYIRIIGVYQNQFFLSIWARNRNQQVVDVPQIPLSTQFDYTNVRISVKGADAYVDLILDWTKITADMGFVNNDQSGIVLNFETYNEDLPQMRPNLFVLDGILNGQYIGKDGIIRPLAGWIVTDYIPVEPNTTYICTEGLPFINYYSSSKTRLRGTIDSDRHKTFTTQENDYYVRFSVDGYSNIELIALQKVQFPGQEIDISCVAIRNDENINDGNFAVGKIDGGIAGTFKFGQAGTTENQISLATSVGEKLIGTSIVGSYQGNIKKLHFNCVCDSTFMLTFGLGNIDQRRWGLISRTFTATVTNGENTIDISQEIKDGERLFVIANSLSTGVNAKLYLHDNGIHFESQDAEIVMSQQTGAIAIEYVVDGKKITTGTGFVETNVFNESISDVNSKINNLSLNKLFIKSNNDKLFRLSVSDLGELGTVPVPVLGNILVMGNSYDVHGYVEGLWWGDFGMAASRKENDWKHQLLSKLLIDDDLNYEFTKQALAGWETTWNRDNDTVNDIFDYSTLESLAGTPNYSMVIIRVGENNTDVNYPRVQLRVRNLLNYIVSKLGNNVPIVMGACVKVRTEQNPSFEAVAQEFANVTYVDMTPAGRLDTFAAGLNYRVLGDDGVWHTISESSQADAVAGHPNDAVFKKMSELFYPVVRDILTQ